MNIQDSVEFDCEATDVCNLKSSYTDFNVNLQAAHDCMIQKCPEQWNRYYFRFYIIYTALGPLRVFAYS